MTAQCISTCYPPLPPQGGGDFQDGDFLSGRLHYTTPDIRACGNRVTLTFDLLTSESMRAERLS